MRWTLLLTFWAFIQAQDADEDRLDFSTTFVGRTKSNEEVVQGTISLNGTITPETVSKLNWAAQNALVQACGHGSKVIANAVLELSWVTRRGVDIKFFVLPRLGGGGDCARTLVESSAGGYEPPFPVTGPTRKPIFRNMMQNDLDILGFGTLFSDMYMRLWRVTCQTEPVWRNANSLTELNAATVCSTYAGGWEVYFEPSITEPATAVGFPLGYSTGNGNTVMGQFDDKCLVANSPCFCSSMQSCGWRRREDGITFHCKTLDSGDTAQRVTCNHCAQQPGCPPSCSSASFPCQCASLASSTTCHWDADMGQCMDGAASSGDNVPCSTCALQDKCQALRPKAWDFWPKQIFPLTRTGPKSMIEVNFNMALQLPSIAARGAARFMCGTDGRQPLTNSLTLLEYVVPADAFSVQDNTLYLASGTVEVVEPTECTLVLSSGVVHSLADGLPSQPVDFGSYFFKLKDSLPPKIMTMSPENGAGSVPLNTRYIRITFTERIRTTANFTCTLTRTDIFGVILDPPISVGIESVRERMLNLNVEGIFLPGRFYQLEISPESVIDYGSLPFSGLKGDAYKFKTSGDFQDVQTVDNNVDEGLPTAAIGGIAAAAVLLVLTGIFLCYKGYLAASEKHEDEVKMFSKEEDNTPAKDKKNGPPPVFGEDALRDLQIGQLPETPDNRKDGAVLFAFDDSEQLRETAMEEGKTAPTNRRISRASLRAEAFVDPHATNATNQHAHHHHHDQHGRRLSGNGPSNEPSNRHSHHGHQGHHGHGHTNQRVAPSAESRGARTNQPAQTVRPPTSSKKESPHKEPPKLKPGFFLRAWDSKSSG